MAQNTIDKIINIQFKYVDLVNGWAEASKAIDNANAKLKEFKKEGDAEGIAKQTQLIKALRGEMNQYTREIQANVREEVKAEGSINQLNAKITKLTAQYNALSGDVRKSSVGEALAKEIAEVQTEVNKANEAVLNFRNNVGNYASAAKGFSGLTFSIQQVARELPSLTNSLSQFFLAISNNLPILGDDLTRAKEANKALKAEGKATIPVFKQVVSAIFSWQTALVVGITLLTAFGKEIANWVKGLFSAKEASITMEEAARNVNKALEEGGYGIGEQIAKVKSLQTAWNNLGDDLDARKKFITDNKDAFDELGVKVTDVNDAENLLVRNTDAFIEALKARAQAAAGQKLAAEAYEKALIEEQKLKDKLNELDSGRTREAYTAEGYEALKNSIKSASKEITDSLKQQAQSYIDLSIERELAAKKILDESNIEEQYSDKQSESIRQIMSLEELQYRMREKNLSQYTSALSKQQQDWGKIASKIESELQKELAKTDKEIGKEFEKQIADQQHIYNNRIEKARLNNGDLGAAKEMLAIYQEQLDQLDRMDAVYSESGKTDLDIQTMRIEARQKVQQAETDIANIQFQNTQRQLNIAGQTAGALSSMFEALGGESEKYAAFAKSMAVMQVILTQAIAIAKAVQGGAEYPFPFNIIAVAGSVAAITAAIASSVNTVKSTEVPKYAAGGLVSGPGTGTSDSIPARLSNGEAVMTAAAVNEWGSMLSAMNISSGGNAINVSNLPQRGDGMRGMERMMERVMMNMPTPVVSVVDINKGQRRVKVQDNISKLGRKK
jgi:hypothetical protein